MRPDPAWPGDQSYVPFLALSLLGPYFCTTVHLSINPLCDITSGYVHFYGYPVPPRPDAWHPHGWGGGVQPRKEGPGVQGAAP